MVELVARNMWRQIEKRKKRGKKIEKRVEERGRKEKGKSLLKTTIRIFFAKHSLAELEFQGILPFLK